MRLSIIIPALILGLALIVGAMLFAPRRPPVPVVAPPQPPATATQPFATSPVKHPSQEAPLQRSLPPKDEQEAQAEYRQSRISELYSLTTDNPDAVSEIMASLGDPDPAIRRAAIDACVQSKKAETIPALKDALDQSTDLDEKVHIQKAIDFLNMAFQATNR